ncbi:MAG: hypothetical protein AAGB24_08355 [Bacteroidota bacterium]
MKNTRQLIVATVISLLTIAPISCNSDDDSNSDCQDAICTTVLVRIMVSITDQNQDPVALDSFKVVNRENGNDMTIALTPSELAAAQQFGQYPLIEDGSLGVNQERQIQFQGFVNNQEVISSDYTVGTDCCHVGLVDGNLQLTL